jgi:hypothetical protein
MSATSYQQSAPRSWAARWSGIALGERGRLIVASAIAFLVVLAFGVWIIAPRFSISGPSVVDDWSAIDNSPHALDRLAHLDYDPAGVNDPHRYRPGYIAVWNSLEWHTLGAPGHMTGPNAWNLLRLALFVAALLVLPLMLIPTSPRSRLGPVWTALLAALPPAMVFATTMTGEDFGRLGPVEPLLVAGMVLGATVLALATRRFIELGRLRRDRRLLGAAAIAAAGYLVWLFGVYQKEASVCFLAMAPFLYLYLNRRWRESGAIDRALYRYRAFQVTAVAMLLPVFHMLFELKKLANEGTTVYGAPVPAGTGGAVHRLRDAFDLQWNGMTLALGTSFWRGALIAISLLLVAVAIRRRRIPWLSTGLIATGWAAFAFQGLSGASTPRYYLPTMALFGIAAALLLAQVRVWPRVVAVAVALIFVLGNAGSSRDNVETWARGDRDVTNVVGLLADLNPDRCRVYMSGVEAEVADGFPELVGLKRPLPARDCGASAAFMFTRLHPERITPVTNEAILHACAGPGWTEYRRTETWRILRCGKLKRGTVDGQPVERVLAEDRFVPGQRFSERKKELQ